MKLNKLKFVYIFIIVLLFILFGISFAFNIINLRNSKDKSMENIIFFGDSITAGYDLNKYYSNKHIVNKGISGNKTEDLLNRIETDVFQYNPSKVIVLIGINDLTHGVDSDDILLNIESIINEIQLNRPKTKIYIESIYPVGVNRKDVDNKAIKDLNIKIKKLCKLSDVIYINVFDHLIDKEGNLKKTYTRDDLHLTNLGYLKVTSVLSEYVEE